MFLRSLVKLNNFIFSLEFWNFINKFRCKPPQKSLCRKLVLFQPGISEFCPQIQMKTKTKRSSPHFGSISVRNFEFHVAKWILTIQKKTKTKGRTYFAPFSVRYPLASPKSTPNVYMWCNKFADSELNLCNSNICC